MPNGRKPRKSATWEGEGYAVYGVLPKDRPAVALWTHLSIEEADRVADALPFDNVAVLSVTGADWNRDFSPWPAKAAFRGGEDFAGGASSYLKTLADALIPGAESAFDIRPGKRAIAGYSLAGLFSLYALLESGLFCGAASVSGSLWYDGFLDHIRARATNASNAAVYLLLGDAEARTKNPRLCTVWEKTKEAEGFLRRSGANVFFEANPGGHFADPPGRMIKGMQKILRMMEEP